MHIKDAIRKQGEQWATSKATRWVLLLIDVVIGAVSLTRLPFWSGVLATVIGIAINHLVAPWLLRPAERTVRALFFQDLGGVIPSAGSLTPTKAPRQLTDRGYVAEITHDPRADLFRGRVINTVEPIEFSAYWAHHISHAFTNAIDAYLKRCRDSHLEPERPRPIS
jgi:hypothetical protein